MIDPRIRVLLISDTVAGGDGGVALCVSRLGTELALLGAEVEYIYATDEGNGHRTYLSGLPKPLRLYDPFVGAVRLRNVLAPLVERFDLLHSHGSNAIFDTVVALQLLRRRRPIHHVATLHGTDHMVLAALLGEMRQRREAVGPKQLALVAHYGLADVKEHIAYKRVSALIARSEGVAAEASSVFGLAATSINPGTDFSAMAQTMVDDERRQALRTRFGFGADELVVLYAGRPAWRKGLSYLREAIELGGRPFTLAVAGQEGRSEGRITYLGAVPHQDMPALYSAADAFCMPSVYEPFGLVLLDAMAAGLACVSSDTAGGQSMLEDGVNGLLVPRRDVPALVKALYQLRDAGTRLQLGVAARQTARQFTWRREAEQTLAWYEQQLRRRASSVSPHSHQV